MPKGNSHVLLVGFMYNYNNEQAALPAGLIGATVPGLDSCRCGWENKDCLPGLWWWHRHVVAH